MALTVQTIVQYVSKGRLKELTQCRHQAYCKGFRFWASVGLLQSTRPQGRSSAEPRDPGGSIEGMVQLGSPVCLFDLFYFIFTGISGGVGDVSYQRCLLTQKFVTYVQQRTGQIHSNCPPCFDL